MGYREVQDLLLNGVREDMDVETAARDERHMTRAIAKLRGIDPEFVDSAATVLNNIDEYDSKEAAMKDITVEEL